MVHILTSNAVPIRSIREYNDNFLICHLSTSKIVVFNPPKTCYNFHLYHQEEYDISTEGEYENTDDMKFLSYPVVGITEALDRIASSIIHEVESIPPQAGEDDIPDEHIIAVACGYNWTPQVVKYLNTRFAEAECDLKCLNLYQYMKVVDIQKMANIVKQSLGSEFVYPEDPIAFSFSIHKAMMG